MCFLLFCGLPLDSLQSLGYRRQGDDDQCDDCFRSQIGSVVGQGVYHRVGEVFRRVGAEENPSGEEREEIASEDTGDISFDETMFRVREQTGESQSSEGEQVIPSIWGRLRM